MNKKLILNALGFNVVWFAWALGVPANQLIVPAFLSVLLIGWHLKTSLSAKRDFQLMTICLATGFVFDTTIQLLDFVEFAAINPKPLNWLQPWWMALMWMAFACTLNHSMAWLGRVHWLLSAFLSGLFGYLVSPAKFLFSFKREQIEGWCKRPSDLIDCYGKILPNLFERKKGFEPQTGNCPQEPPDVVTNRTTDGM